MSEKSPAPVQEEATPTPGMDAERVTRLRKALSDAALVCRGDAADETRSIAYRVERERSANDFTALASSLPALLEARRRYELLAQSLNDDEGTCSPACNKFGHAHDCESGKAATIITNLQQQLSGSISERETLTAQNAELRESWYAGFFSHAKSTEEPEPIAENEIVTIGANALAVKNGRDWPVVSPVETATTLLRLIGEIRRCEERSTHHALLLHESRAAVARLTTERDTFRDWFQNAEQARAVAEAKLAS